LSNRGYFLSSKGKRKTSRSIPAWVSGLSFTGTGLFSIGKIYTTHPKTSRSIPAQVSGLSFTGWGSLQVLIVRGNGQKGCRIQGNVQIREHKKILVHGSHPLTCALATRCPQSYWPSGTCTPTTLTAPHSAGPYRGSSPPTRTRRRPPSEATPRRPSRTCSEYTPASSSRKISPHLRRGASWGTLGKETFRISVGGGGPIKNQCCIANESIKRKIAIHQGLRLLVGGNKKKQQLSTS
jgi:hypothetical protein